MEIIGLNRYISSKYVNKLGRLRCLFCFMGEGSRRFVLETKQVGLHYYVYDYL